MSEKRKPVFVVIAQVPGKSKNKIELFLAQDFRQINHGSSWRQYRMRVNGKWFNNKGQKYTCFSIWEFRDLFIRATHKAIDARWNK